MTNPTIRNANEADSPAVFGLLTQLGYQPDKQQLQTFLTYAQHSGDVLVATIEDEIQAVMSLIYFDYLPMLQKVCRITAIVVNEKSRGSGLGSVLIEQAKQQGRIHNCTQLEVTTSLQRHQTQKFYEGIGFTKSSFRYIQSID